MSEETIILAPVGESEIVTISVNAECTVVVGPMTVTEGEYVA